MYKIVLLSLSVLLLFSSLSAKKINTATGVEYVVVASKCVMADLAWRKVAEKLQEKHQALLFQYENSPEETLKDLQSSNPRYVAFVEKPENIGPDYIGTINQLSRRIDKDIYADFLWGVITGYDVENAMKLVENGGNSLVVRNVFSTSAFRDEAILEKFDRYAWIDDVQMAKWGRKQAGNIEFKAVIPSGETIIDTASKTEFKAYTKADFFDKFFTLYQETEPDWVLTGAYSSGSRWYDEAFSINDFHSISLSTAFQFPLPFVPFALINSKAGKIYADYPEGMQALPENGKPKAYIAAGDNFGGNVANSKESLPIAWLNGGNAAGLTGYVVPNWYGVGGYGIVKYWITDAGRYSLPEAAFLNRQDIIGQLNRWNPKLATMNFPYNQLDKSVDIITETTGIEKPLRAQIGCLYDRDVMAYYGDPKWNVRLQKNSGSDHYTVTVKKSKRKCVISVVTHADFEMKQITGEGYKSECTSDLPFSYFFPQRLPNACLAAGQKWDVALDENFILIYNAKFEANKTYEIVVKFDEKMKK